MFGVVATGSGPILDLHSQDTTNIWTRVLGALAAVLGALDLTFDLSNRARAHGLSRRNYYDALAEYELHNFEECDARSRLTRLSAGEEPERVLIMRQAWNSAQTVVFGDNARRLEIPNLPTLLLHIWPWPGDEKYKVYSRKGAADAPKGLS